ncbi:MAG: bifunctional DNA-formamidopyrimidine glycosylase/DNA-(apurinic or apyrimidinic site) lyase [bacterium]|nr:bifunctional DNA-formamidopyrimidine glycosylase/DNA-(apurinic or apyrimidinic site) lyase [bacterium]
MPELPEVETIKRSLAKALVGKIIKDIEVRKPKIFQGDRNEVIGRKIESVERKGKVLIVNLEGEKSLMIHFKLTGQMVWASQAGTSITLGHPIPYAGSTLPAKTTHVIFDINGGKLFYNDVRQFGWIKVVQNSESSFGNLLGKLGPEPFDKDFNLDYLKKVFSKTSKPVKLVLLDQEKMAGIGNIYANEALFEAKIMPARKANSLGDKEIEKLQEAIILVLEEGIKYGGSSAADEAYIQPDGNPGRYQEHFRVYQKKGQKCPRCKGVVERINLGGRGTFYCPACQR